MICVYKILSPDLQECYVGSTTDFSNRKICHKDNTCSSRILFEKYGFDNCPFVVLEQCNKDELIDKEQWWMDHSVGLVNLKNAKQNNNDRKKKQKNYSKNHREANKEKIKEQQKKWYEANKEKRKESSKEYRKKYYDQTGR